MAFQKVFFTKMWVMAVLASAAVVLGGILISQSNVVEQSTAEMDRKPSPAEMKTIVDSLARVFSIPDAVVRQRRESVGKKLQLMPEHRIEVSSDFSTLGFNRALSRSVARFGSIVAGEERPREKKTVLRVLHNDKQVWTVIFSANKTAGGKESNNRR